MKVIPLRSYQEPGFPTRAILDAHPELLRLVPKRWRGNPLVLTALAATFVILSGCRSLAAGNGAPAKTSLVAPIFVHGKGHGSFGCVAVNPPVFLSEDEARQVITDEAQKAGILFSADAKRLPGIAIPLTTLNWHANEEGKTARRWPTRSMDLTLDGADRKRNIAYEYMSRSDYAAWQNKDETDYGSSVNTYGMLDTAQELRKGVAAASPAGAYAIFYDPLSRYVKASSPALHMDWQARRKEATNTAREEVRKQVRDFIAWLKAQGVI